MDNVDDVENTENDEKQFYQINNIEELIELSDLTVGEIIAERSKSINFRKPHEIIVIENIENSFIKIQSTHDSLRIIKITDCQENLNNNDIVISTFSNTMLRSILIENCHNCQIDINSSLLTIKVIDCSEILINQYRTIIKSIEALRCSDSVIYIRAPIPLVQIEISHNFSVCQKNEVIDYFITGDCERVFLNTIDNSHKLCTHYEFDMVITDRLFSFNLDNGIGESRIPHFTALSMN